MLEYPAGEDRVERRILERQPHWIGAEVRHELGEALERGGGRPVEALSVVERHGIHSLLQQERRHLTETATPVEQAPRLAPSEVAGKRPVLHGLRPGSEIRIDAARHGS